VTELGNGCGPEAGMRRRPEVVRRSLDRYLDEEIDGQDWPLATAFETWPLPIDRRHVRGG
jgi:hypothetical protein